MGEGKRHHWKIWLVIILIGGILGLVFYTEGGKKTMEFFKIGKFSKSSPVVSGKFLLSLSSDKDSFYAQSYLVENSTFSGTGICQPNMIINDITVQKQGTRCNVTIENMKGRFDYTSAGSIIVSADSNFISIDDAKFSSGKLIHVQVELIPFEFFLTNLVQDKMTIHSSSGQLARLRDDGSVKDISYLTNSSIDIFGFSGLLKLEGGNAKMSGSAGSVKGQDFSW